MSDDYILVPPDYEDEEPQSTALVASGAKGLSALAPSQALQIGIWLVEGFSNSRIRSLMEENEIPLLSVATIQKMRHNDGLIEEARQYLRKEYTVTGLAERAIRIRRLQKHAEKLEQLMEETGLIEVSTKVVAFGKKMDTIEERKFAALLSKEYRETLEQIKRETEPLERVVIGSQTNVFMNISEEDKAQILRAMQWTPATLPQILVEGPSTEDFVEGEARTLDDPV